MGTLKVDTIQDSGGNTILSSDGSGGFSNSLPAGKTSNFRNFIINGDMQVAQRGAGPSGAFNSSGYSEGPDRFKVVLSSMGNWKSAQTTTVPTGQGFSKSFQLDCDAADASPAASDSVQFVQYMEGQNLQSLKKGTSNAESITVSFWVRSNKTGTYTLELYDNDNTRQISKTYTINSADTWEKKIVNFAADTTGALDNDNALSFAVQWWLGAGSNYTSGTLSETWTSVTTANRVSSSQVNLADNTANEWYITGIQMEVGTTASDFEFLPYDVNFQRCQRYYTQVATLSGLNGHGFFYGYNVNEAPGCVIFPTTMRTTPTVTTYDNAGNSGAIHKFGAPDISGVTVARASTIGYGTLNTSGSFVAGGIYIGTWKADAEL